MAVGKQGTSRWASYASVRLTRRGLAGVRPDDKSSCSVCGLSGSQLRGYCFSAFWLRSSVVSVLISLISDTILIENEDINLIFGVARVASGLPGLPVTGCLCIALQQSTADPARGSRTYKERSPTSEAYSHFFFCSFRPISLHALAWYWAPQ